ncbi:MAG: restriction endonuclease subunit S [Marmoricola sp.]
MKTAQLRDVARLDYGFAFDSKQFNSEGRGLPLVRIRDVVPGRSDTYYSGEYTDRYLVSDGDYLIGMDGQFNLARWQGGKALLNQRVCRIGELDASLDRAYLARFMPLALKTIEDATPFVTVKHLSAKALNAIQVPLPPLPEQRRIAAILDQADALRAKRRQVLTHLDSLTKSIFNDMFGAACWDSTLVDIADVQIGPFGSLLHREDYVSDGVPVINPMHIRDGQLQPDGEFSVSENKAASLSTYRLCQGDVVLGRRGEMGRAGIAGPQHVGMLCGTGSLILRPRGVDSRFLHSVVTSSRMKGHLERSSLGATLPNLNATIVKASPAPQAPADAQAEFAERLAAAEATVGSARRAANVDDHLFVSLQSRAFRGEL